MAEAEEIIVDGSHGEGGGQIIRNAVSYSCLLRRKIQVKNIRANRPNPGLASQHLESILAMMRISGAKSSRQPKKGDTQFDMDGTPVSVVGDGVTTTVDLVTAGSVTLCIQCMLPYLLSLKSPSKISIIGGTHVMKSPSFDYLQRVFLPAMKNIIGYDVKATLKNPGYFPRGGGRVDVHVDPTSTNSQFKHFDMTERGKLLRSSAILNVTHKMKHVIDRLKDKIFSDIKNVEVRIVSYASVEYFLEFENNSAGFSFLAEGRNPTPDNLFDGINRVQKEMNQFLNSDATLDQWMQDQMIIYMALAKCIDPNGTSSIRTVTPTDHTLSAIHVSQLYSPKNEFSVVKNDQTVTISI